MRIRYVKESGGHGKGDKRDARPDIAQRLIGLGIAVLDDSKPKPQGRVNQKKIRAGEAVSHEPEGPVGG